jgi:hypothetical protein
MQMVTLWQDFDQARAAFQSVTLPPDQIGRTCKAPRPCTPLFHEYFINVMKTHASNCEANVEIHIFSANEFGVVAANSSHSFTGKYYLIMVQEGRKVKDDPVSR